MSSEEDSRVTGEHLRKLLRAYLEGTAASVQHLVAFTGFNRELVLRELGWLIEGGEVEVLLPVAPGGEVEEAERAAPAYYRRVRPSDRDFLWEQEEAVRASRNRKANFAKVWTKTTGNEEQELAGLDTSWALSLAW